MALNAQYVARQIAQIRRQTPNPIIVSLPRCPLHQ